MSASSSIGTTVLKLVYYQVVLYKTNKTNSNDHQRIKLQSKSIGLTFPNNSELDLSFWKFSGNFRFGLIEILKAKSFSKNKLEINL